MNLPANAEINSAAELFELAHSVEAYVNNSGRLQRKKTRNSVAMLNEHAAHLYAGSPVNLTGIYLYSSPGENRARPDAVDTNLTLGSITGAAGGFTYLDLEEDIAPYEANFDIDQFELLDTLRERAFGKIAICHWVHILQGSWEQHPKLTETLVTYRAIGPISSTNLFVDKRYDPLSFIESHKEVARILDTFEPGTRKLIDHICGVLAESDDPIMDLSKNGRKLREVLSNVNEIDRLAVMHILDIHLREKVIGQKFRFDNGLPLSIELAANGCADLTSFDSDIPYTVSVHGIANAQHYPHMVDESTILSEWERGLFLKATVWNDGGESAEMLMPVEHIDKYSCIPVADQPIE